MLINRGLFISDGKGNSFFIRFTLTAVIITTN